MSIMRRNVHFKTFPNLSLLFGYTFILLIMVIFGYIQYTSSVNLKNIDEKVLSLTLTVAKQKTESDITRLTDLYRELLDTGIFFDLQQTFQNPEPYLLASEIENCEQLIYSLEVIANILGRYEADLFRSQTILLITFIGFSVILFIFLTISEFDQIKKLEEEKSQRIIDQKLMEILENERNLIAIELHDDVAQKLSVLGQHFNSSVNAEHTELLKRYIENVIHKIRTMAQTLRSSDILGMNFQEQLEFLFSDFKSISDTELTGRFNGLSALTLSDEKILHLYRIIQELLSNCRKHSLASTVDINVLYVHPILNIKYHDDGKGFKEDLNVEGLGLRSIEYRLNILKGQMEMFSENGLTVNIQIPVEL